MSPPQGVAELPVKLITLPKLSEVGGALVKIRYPVDIKVVIFRLFI